MGRMKGRESNFWFNREILLFFFTSMLRNKSTHGLKQDFLSNSGFLRIIFQILWPALAVSQEVLSLVSQSQCFLALGGHGGPLSTKVWVVTLRFQSLFSSLSNPRLSHECLSTMSSVSQEKISALKKQASHIVQQAQREQDHFVKEKNNLIMMLQRVSPSCCTVVTAVTVSGWGRAVVSGVMTLHSEKAVCIKFLCCLPHW